jgi:hypothetical protein
MPYYARRRPVTPTAEWISLGLVPPWVLTRTVVPFGEYYWGTHSYSYYDPAWYEFDAGQSVTEILVPAMLGLSLYAIAARLLATAAGRRFQRATAGLLPRRPPAVLVPEPVA